MIKPVKIFSKEGIVTLKVGNWPFRQTVRWNVHDGDQARNLANFANGLLRASSRSVRTKAKKK